MKAKKTKTKKTTTQAKRPVGRPKKSDSMAQRKNKKRKVKTEQFKNAKKTKAKKTKVVEPIMKKSENQIPAGTSFRWNPNDKIVISGEEFAIINSFLKQFEMPLAAVSNIFNRMVEAGIAVPENGSVKPKQNPETFAHVVTQDDLDNNPELVKAGVQVGETIYIPIDAEPANLTEKPEVVEPTVVDSTQTIANQSDIEESKTKEEPTVKSTEDIQLDVPATSELTTS